MDTPSGAYRTPRRSLGASSTSPRRFTGPAQPHIPRLSLEDAGTLGPGAAPSLAFSSTVRSAPAPSFGRRASARDARSRNPGPGAYATERRLTATGTQPLSTKPSAPAFGFSKSPRFNEPGSARSRLASTGASLYMTRTSMASARGGSDDVDASPGPSAYRPSWKLMESRPSVSVRGKPKARKAADTTPAPGDYDIPSVFHPKHRKGPLLPVTPAQTDERLKHMTLASASHPSPAQYSPRTNFRAQKKGSHVFGTSPRFAPVHGYIPRG